MRARSVPGVCNAYLPEDSVLNRFLWVVNYFAGQGFYIILDNQFNLDQTATQNTPQWLSRVRCSCPAFWGLSPWHALSVCDMRNKTQQRSSSQLVGFHVPEAYF
jgi:hypothetical protein